MQSQSTKSASRAYGLIESDLRMVQSLIEEQIVSSSPAVADILSYIRTHHGKMLRPALVLLSGRTCGPITALHPQIGAIVEMMHTATLLHDDVIDESTQRRGHKTVNNLFGNEAAVLSGDFLFSKVFRMCAELPDRAIGKILADTCIRICHGELEQNFHRYNWQLSEADYIKIVTEKSASFLSSCCHLGALAAGAGQGQTAALTNFGLNVGIAFQIIDDVLDIEGNEHAMGKRTGSDFEMSKLTLPVIHLLSNTELSSRPALIQTLGASEQGRQSRDALLRQNGCVDYARSRAGQFHKAAIETLTEIPESEAKTALVETADFCLSRTG
jgi:octaprenyl-diphosphate synthase